MATTRFGTRYYLSDAQLETRPNGDLAVFERNGSNIYTLQNGVLTTLLTGSGGYGTFKTLSDGAYLFYGDQFEGFGLNARIIEADGTIRAGELSNHSPTGSIFDIRGAQFTERADGSLFLGETDTEHANESVSISYPDRGPEYGDSRYGFTTTRGTDVGAYIFDANLAVQGGDTIVNTGSYTVNGATTDYTFNNQRLDGLLTLANGSVVMTYASSDVVGDTIRGGYANQSVIDMRIVTPDGTVSGNIRVNTDAATTAYVPGSTVFYPSMYQADGRDGEQLVSLGANGFAVIWHEQSLFADGSVFGGYRYQGYDTKIRYFDVNGNALTDEINILHRDGDHGGNPLVVKADAIDGGRIALLFKQTFASDGTGAYFIETVGALGSSLSATMVTDGLQASTAAGYSYDLEAIGGGNVAVTYYDAAYDIANPGPQPAQAVETFRITGATGAVLFGTDNGDTRTGSRFDDQLYGFAGGDSLSGGGGRDFLNGGYGGDVLDGGTGADMMLGGDGGDVYYVDNVADQVRDNGGASDVYNNVATDTVYASVSWFANYWSQAEALVANAGSKGLRLGTDIPNLTILGGVGNDTLDGGTGSFQTLNGGAGNDTYYVGGTYYFVPGGDTVIEAAGGGSDKVYANTDFTLAADAEIEFLYANAGSTGLALTGSDIKNTITGGDGNDTLNGAGGNDSLFGGTGADRLRGDAGADTLTGGGGADDLDGGADDDTYNADSSDTVVDTGSSGADKVISVGNFTLATGSGIERLETRPGSANVSLTGNELGNRIDGNDGANTLKGLAGADTIYGGIGIDTLDGGAGQDNLYGQANGDVFRFTAAESGATASAYDFVLDFVGGSGGDRIDLDIVGAGGLAASAYAETTVANDGFGNAASAANALLDGTVKVAFVAGVTGGWAFWDAAADGTADGAIRLKDVNNVNLFDFGDVI